MKVSIMSDGVSRAPHEPARASVETARASQRPCTRTTLQPTVHDFNGNIINKAVDEDQMVWLAGKHHQHLLKPGSGGGESAHAFSVPPALRRPGPFSPLYWDAARPPFLAAAKSDRVAAWTEEVHRRHVTRTARARARLSAKPRGGGGGVVERVVASVGGGGGGVGGVYGAGNSSECSFSLSLPDNAVDVLEEVRLSSLSRASSRTGEALMTSRARPATTGRYFDSSNGLRNIRSSPAVFRSRPATATPWAGPGLKIKKVTLHHKELMT